MRGLLPAVIILLVANAVPLAARQATAVGFVTDSSTGDPLRGVSVSLVGEEPVVETDATGWFELPGVESGRQTILFSHAGYEPWSTRLEFSLNSGITEIFLGSFGLSPALEATLTGVISDSLTGHPLEGATVLVLEDSVQVATDGEGHFELAGVRSGRRTMVVRLPGYVQWVAQFQIQVIEATREVYLGTLGLVPADEGTRFVGFVIDSTTGTAMEGVTVTALDGGQEARTDAEGRFALTDLQTDVATLLIRQVGYQPRVLRAEVTPGPGATFVDLGSITLSPAAVELDPIVIDAEETQQILQTTGFLQRRAAENGTFLTHREIDAMNLDRTSEVLRRVVGLTTYRDGTVANTRGVPSIMTGATVCDVDYYVDGVFSRAQTADVLPPSVIAGIEVYRGASSIPTAFQGAGNSKCGAVVIWTRKGRTAR